MSGIWIFQTLGPLYPLKSRFIYSDPNWMFLSSRQQHTGKWRAFSYIFPSCLMALIVNITRYFSFYYIHSFNNLFQIDWFWSNIYYKYKYYKYSQILQIYNLQYTNNTNVFRFWETEAERVCIDFSQCGKCAREPYFK